jgi:hypothetical protein
VTALLLVLGLAHAHTPQAGLVEVVLEDDASGTLRWRAPDTGPAAGLVPALPEGCTGEVPSARRGEAFVETSVRFRCARPPAAVVLGGLDPGGRAIATVRRSGGTSRRLVGDDGVLDLAAPPSSPPRPPSDAAGPALLVVALSLLGTPRARPIAHALGVLGGWLLLRTLVAV